MTEDERFGLSLTRWLTGFIVAAILVFSFATENDMTYFSQHNKEYKNTKFSGGTIDTDGCGICCAAMVLNINPVEIAKEYDYYFPKQSNKGTNPKFFSILSEEYDFEFKKSTKLDYIKSMLEDGWICIAQVNNSKWSDCRHYIVIYKYDGKKYRILDPNSSSITKSSATAKDLADVEYYYLFKK